jgi:hypothetical protein
VAFEMTDQLLRDVEDVFLVVDLEHDRRDVLQDAVAD